MIRFLVENKARNIGDILYGVQETQTDLYTVEFLPDELSPDSHVLTEARTFFVRDQTPLTDPTAGFVAYDKRNSLLLFNRVPVTADDMLSFYENVTVISGAWVAIGHEAATYLREFNENTGHIECAIEELDGVEYPGQYNGGAGVPWVYLDGRLAHVFGQYVHRLTTPRDDSEEALQQVKVLPFQTTDDVEVADVFLSFENHSREVLRMIDSRVKSVYVPSEPKTWVFDPRSLFKCSRQLIDASANLTDHEVAAQLRPLFEDMVTYISDVFVTDSKVKYMKLKGSVPLFDALAYNLSRTV